MAEPQAGCHAPPSRTPGDRTNRESWRVQVRLATNASIGRLVGSRDVASRELGLDWGLRLCGRQFGPSLSFSFGTKPEVVGLLNTFGVSGQTRGFGRAMNEMEVGASGVAQNVFGWVLVAAAIVGEVRAKPHSGHRRP